jgi:hypothetical protein
MSIRERMQTNKVLGVSAAVSLLFIAAISFAIQFWPHKKPNLTMQYYTDDDGQTWFASPISQVPPFDHNGKTAVIAELYTYDNGSKTFCAYVSQYTPEAKQKLESAFADAQAKGQPLNTVPLLNDPYFVRTGMLVKALGANNEWIPYSDPRANQVFSIHSPDGSTVDEVFVY